jgi:uncharacterized membrane protein
LDLIGLGIASYLSIEELQNKPLAFVTGGIFDCNAVARASYSRPFAGIPVAVYGVFLSLTLFVAGDRLVADQQLQAPAPALRPVAGRGSLRGLVPVRPDVS